MHDLSLHILDLIENSLRARATIVSVHVDIDAEAGVLLVRVEDNGEGIRVPPEEALHPFYTTHGTKRVGLGLSFCKAAAEMAGGKLILARSEELGGVAVTVRLELMHVNRPPLGDLAATLGTMIFMNPSVDFRLSIRSGEACRRFMLSEFRKMSGLDAGMNVQLAGAALKHLRTELEPWNKCEWITWMACRPSEGAPLMSAREGKQ